MHTNMRGLARLTREAQAVLVVGVQALQEDPRPLMRHHQPPACTNASTGDGEMNLRHGYVCCCQTRTCCRDVM